MERMDESSSNMSSVYDTVTLLLNGILRVKTDNAQGKDAQKVVSEDILSLVNDDIRIDLTS